VSVISHLRRCSRLSICGSDVFDALLVIQREGWHIYYWRARSSTTIAVNRKRQVILLLEYSLRIYFQNLVFKSMIRAHRD